jgi:hypothetical protein
MFLDEPEYYSWGCASLIAPRWRKRFLIAGGVVSAVALLVLAVVPRAEAPPVERALGAVVVVAFAWGILLVFRLFVTAMMWVFDVVSDALGEADPRFMRPLHYVRLGYWVVLDVFVLLAFFGMLVSAVAMPFIDVEAD